MNRLEKLSRILLPAIALWLLAAGPAASAEPNYMTLNGITRVAIEVDGVRDDFARFGLESGDIRERTARALSENGIEVVDDGMLAREPGTALLRIDLNAHENLYRFFMYGLSVEIVQKIPLNNEAAGYIGEIVWQQGQTGIVMPTEMRKLNGVLADLLARFLSDYHSQNPQRVSVAGDGTFR